MKSTKTILILFALLNIFACNNKQQKTTEEHSTPINHIKPITEEDLKKKAKPAMQAETKWEDCEELVTEILKTSHRFKQITKGLTEAVIKNGGTGYGVSTEIAINTNTDKTLKNSKTYNFTLYEKYPDRQLNTARFTFDPTKNQLYEYDVVADSLKPIQFDRELLVKLDSCCK